MNTQLFDPADHMRGGAKRLAPTSRRLYFHDTFPIQKVNNRHVETWRAAHKNLRSHLSKHGDVQFTRHYVLIGTRRYSRSRQVSIFEYSTGNLWRSPDDRDFKRERSPEFRALRTQHRIERMGGKYA